MHTHEDREKPLAIMMSVDVTDATQEINSLRSPELYSYQKLWAPDQCIRLLRLQPGTGNQEIICELVEHDLFEKSEICYEALSWCWGNGTRSNKITIRCGISTFSSMIPQNLLDALVALRLKESIRVLWVDALCINQADPEEKSFQIPMMSRIYRRAEKVCIWLGQDEHMGAGIEFIKSEVLKLDSFDALGENESAKHKWSAIYDMMQTEWFLRRWILQEILFARDVVVYYGSELIPWQEFADAVSLFLKVQTSTDGISDVMKRDPEYYHVPGWIEYISSLGAGILISTSQSLFRISSDGQKIPLRGLESLVHECQMFQNSEPRDTIYALLGLANDTAGMDSVHRDRQYLAKWHDSIPAQWWTPQLNPVNLGAKAYPVNYTQPYAGHCKDFVEFVIRKCSQVDPTRALDILCRPWAPIPIEQQMSDKFLPSWVSSLSNAAFVMTSMPGTGTYRMVRKNADPLVGPPDSNRSKHFAYYAATGDRGVDFMALTFDEQPNYYSLYVYGFIFDRVEHVEVVSLAGCIPLGWLEACGAGWEDGDMPLPDEFWRTLVADRGSDGGTAPAYYKRACETVMQTANWRTGALDLNDPINNGRNALITDFCRRVQAVVWNRQMIRTSGGKAGMARRSVMEGDLICILYGCSVPVILRKHLKDSQEDVVDEQHLRPGEEDAFYELLGECYVHGMMDGEAIEFQEQNAIKSVCFELR
jgi:hypothetical protein